MKGVVPHLVAAPNHLFKHTINDKLRAYTVCNKFAFVANTKRTYTQKQKNCKPDASTDSSLLLRDINKFLHPAYVKF